MWPFIHGWRCQFSISFIVSWPLSPKSTYWMTSPSLRKACLNTVKVNSQQCEKSIFHNLSPMLWLSGNWALTTHCEMNVLLLFRWWHSIPSTVNLMPLKQFYGHPYCQLRAGQAPLWWQECFVISTCGAIFLFIIPPVNRLSLTCLIQLNKLNVPIFLHTPLSLRETYFAKFRKTKSLRKTSF